MQRPRSECAGGLFTEKEAQQYGCSIVIKEESVGDEFRKVGCLQNQEGLMNH